jgi:hypothetical protein
LAVSGTDLYVGGGINDGRRNGVAKWDGTAWSLMSAGLGEGDFAVYALAVSGTDVYAHGYFGMNTTLARWALARWDGSAWTFIGSRLTHGVGGLAVSGNQLYIGGTYGRRSSTLCGESSNFLARLFLDGVPPLEVANGRATVFFRDIPAGGYSIERTTDLETWEHLATRYAGLTGGIDFLDENAPGASAYYRAVPLEP